MRRVSPVVVAGTGVASLSAVVALLTVGGTSPATPAATTPPTAQVARRDLSATVTVAGQIERTDSRAVYWQQPPPAPAPAGPQTAPTGGRAEPPTAPARPPAPRGTGRDTGRPPTTTSTTTPPATTSTATSSTTTSTTPCTTPSTTSTTTSSTTTSTTPCTTISTTSTTSTPTTTTPPPTTDPLAVTPAAADGPWFVAPSAATRQEDEKPIGDGQAQGRPSPTSEPADDQQTVTAVAAEGQAIERGDTLFAIDGRPTVVFTGTEPAFRDLGEGVDDGVDVAQLEANLTALGFDDDGQVTVDETFDADTTAAVEAWQEALGVATTGTVALGDVAFLSPPATVSATQVAVGDRVRAGEHILDLAGETLLAVGSLPVRLTGEVGAGRPTLVSLADGETVSGTVRAVASDATRPDGASVTDSTVELSVQLDSTDSPAAREGADVSLAVTTTTTSAGVLSVPVAAVVDDGDGQPAVRTPAGEVGGEARLVQISAGVWASGYVEIAEGPLAEGDTVLLPGTEPEP